MDKVIYISFIFLCFESCINQDAYIQNVYVDIDINLTLPEYSELSPIGNSIFIEGGVKGIILYHFANSEYRVYDRNCSFEPSLDCAKIDSINTNIATCKCCDSAFLLDQEGTAVNSPAILPLKQYNYTLQGDWLYIFN